MNSDFLRIDRRVLTDSAARDRGRTLGGPEIVKGLKGAGCHVFRDRLPPRTWFKRVYVAYDKVSALFKEQPGLVEDLNTAVVAWHAQRDTRSYYCRIPPSFKDRADREGKRDKEYLQYTLDFAQSEPFLASALIKQPSVSHLFHYLENLHHQCAELFSAGIESLSALDPSLPSRWDDARPLPIVIKLLRYNPHQGRFATGPHFDKSGLSLLLNADDPHVSYRLGRPRDGSLRFTDLVAPIKYPLDPDAANDAVLIAGSCLDKIGLTQVQPTPHCVLPFVGPGRRHSVVAFLVIPHLDTSALSPKAPYLNDYDPQVT